MDVKREFVRRNIRERETWEKVNVSFNENGTVSFHQRKVFHFDPEHSKGDVDDMVVIPNIPMLSATSQSKHAARFLRLAMASIMDILKIKPFVEVSVHQLLWGYEDPLLKLAKDVVPKDQKLPYDEFGLMYGECASGWEIPEKRVASRSRRQSSDTDGLAT
uniref:Scavenger receptor class B member 1 n=1 Tax=Timema genevievae TaxID=629358 RepID=A0A7R9K8S0_TIMGE|nr:unnamed protein product [Timema genevievae]